MYYLKNILSVAVFVGLHLTAQAAISIGEVADALGVTEKDVEILINATDYAGIDVKTWTHRYSHVPDAEVDSWDDLNKIVFLDGMKEICLHPDEAVFGEVSETPRPSRRYAQGDIESRAVRPEGVTFPSGAQLPPRVPQGLIDAVRRELVRMRGGLTVPAGLTLAGCTTASLGLYGTNIDRCIEGGP
ncbi:hypothetical protein B0T11DRAFT_298909 [Plectosphaerella cucumerina]|uniref:Uncharacterized protein n=1 Tax=Plectosphaerella cucumerina TaxID=40658 RepID=A0A8K0T9F8_9PEZI|nr:hypothetical protein B0T11DRAFT_298909 [Plectosphaerella cucumerina]